MATAGPWTALEAAGVPASVLAALPALGYPTMTPVQAAAIPPLLARKDVCVQAETGSGKTLSFLLPAAVLALAEGTRPPDAASGLGSVAPPVAVLIIEPTRELARQVHAVATSLFSMLPGGVVPALLTGAVARAAGDNRPRGGRGAGRGWVGKRARERRRRRSTPTDGANATGGDGDGSAGGGRGGEGGGGGGSSLATDARVVVATPGRLEAALTSGELATSGLSLLVLDEADRLLDMGFRVTLSAILGRLPRQRRTGLYSATQTVALDELAAAGLRNPVRVVVRVQQGAPPGEAAPAVTEGDGGDAAGGCGGVGGGVDNCNGGGDDVSGTAASTLVFGGGHAGAGDHGGSGNGAVAVSTRLPASLRCYYGVFTPEEKLPALLHLLAAKPQEKAIVYLLTCAEVDWYSRLDWGALLALTAAAVDNGGGGHGGSKRSNGRGNGTGAPASRPVFALHGKMTQKKRLRALAAFTAASGGVLLATDVAARGLDVPHVATVLQAAPPQSPEAYIHRVGRSARLGRPGEAVLLLLPSEDTYVDYLAVRSTPAAPLPPAYGTLPAGLATSVAAAIRTATLADRAILEAADSAFLSYLRAYKEHRCGYILRMDNLDIAGVARAFGCLRMPRVAEFAKYRAAMSSFVREPGLDLRAVPYADPAREAARQAQLAAAAAAGPAPRRAPTPRALAAAKKERKRKKRDSAAARLMSVANAAVAASVTAGRGSRGGGSIEEEDAAEMEREARLLRKVKRGKMTEREFERSAGYGGEEESD
ncbi:hypothetical protein MMPV_001358 [Pyropia vietnamensis]